LRPQGPLASRFRMKGERQMKTWIVVLIAIAVVQVSVGGMLVRRIEHIATARTAAMHKAVDAAK